MKHKQQTKQAIDLYSQLATEVTYGFNMKFLLTELYIKEPKTAYIIKKFVDECRKQREAIRDKKST